MENKQAVAVAVGVGAVGTVLIYMGYSVYNSNKDTDNLVAKKVGGKIYGKIQKVLSNYITMRQKNKIPPKM